MKALNHKINILVQKDYSREKSKTVSIVNPICLRLLSFHRTLDHRKRWTLQSTETISLNTDKSMRKKWELNAIMLEWSVWSNTLNIKNDKLKR